MRELLNHRRIRYSQAGEEGVIDEILRRISTRTALARYFCEFGAWDGKHLSNTFFLAERGFAGCMIEGDRSKFEDLARTLQPFPNVKPLCRWVGFEGRDALDEILAEAGTPVDFDVLSIDIDGSDYWVWKALTRFRPKAVVIELMALDKPGAKRIPVVGAAFKWGESGTSITSMRELAESKGYRLVANVGCNAIFVDGRFADLFPAVDEAAAFTYEMFPLHRLTLREKSRRLGEWLRKRVALRRPL